MKVVTRKYAVLSPRELKEQHPEIFPKELDKRGELDHSWWDMIYEDFYERTHMYAPAVCAYFKEYPPTTWPTSQWPDELDQLVTAWQGVITPDDPRPILGFDLDRKDITLGKFRLHLPRFLEVSKFSWPEPLALEAVKHHFDLRVVSVGAGDLWEWYECEEADVAERFLHDVFGVPPLPAAEGYSKDAEHLGEQINACLAAVAEEVKKFFRGLGTEVLRALAADYEYQTSEENFLEQDHLEFEVFLEVVGEQETID